MNAVNMYYIARVRIIAIKLQCDKIGGFIAVVQTS